MFLEKGDFESLKSRKDLFALAEERDFKMNKFKWDLSYEKQLKKLQAELVNLQKWISDNNLRVAVLFEGRDAAGKGGSIKRFTEHLNPRAMRVVALSKPTEMEKVSGILDGILRNYLIPVKLFFLTEVGTTEQL